MTSTPASRRAFLAGAGRSATALLLSLQLPWLTTLEGCSSQSMHEARSFVGLTPREKRTMEAFAGHIFPPLNGRPGAVELGAVRFVDRALGEPFFAGGISLVRTGLADLDTRAGALGRQKDFASLNSRDQETILRQIDQGDFFKAARTLVLIGTFADPAYGGNRDGAGWVAVGIDHRPSYTAPFGFYDAQTVRGRGQGPA